jgi:spermidine/putrescine transport system substrate-binding protein
VADQDLEGMLRRMARTKVNRRGFMAGAGLAGTAAFLAACSRTPAASGGASGGPNVTPLPEGQRELFMFNWADYVAPENQETFKQRYGVTKFTYDTYASNEELLTKLQGGATGQYDFCAPTCEYVPALAEGGFIKELDFDKLPNAKHINKQFQEFFDPNGEQAKYNTWHLPKDWGTTGITIRTKVVTEEVKTWKQFFEVAPKYSGRIVVVDSPGDVFTGPLKALGYSLNTTDPGELEEARQILLAFAPHVLALNSDTYDAQIASEEAVLGLTWTGGIADLKEEEETADTVYVIPEDGTLFWMDTWCIFDDAPHEEAAYTFLNFIHEPDIQAAETVSNRYASPNDEANKLVPKEILDDQTVYVPDEVFSKLEGAQDVSSDPNRIAIWEEFKSKIGQA